MHIALTRLLTTTRLISQELDTYRNSPFENIWSWSILVEEDGYVREMELVDILDSFANRFVTMRTSRSLGEQKIERRRWKEKVQQTTERS